MSKRPGSRYSSGRTDHWIKVKNSAAPAVKREAEEDCNKAAMIDRPNRPRTLKEVAAPQCAADRERLERAEHLMDPTREVTIIEDRARNGDWRVEYFGRDSAGYVTIFTGPEAERRARAYFQALKSGAVGSVG